jgi:hypothetical protein
VFPGPALAISGCPINDCPEDARRHGNLCKPLQLVQGRSDAVTVGPAHTFLTAPKGGERNAFRWAKGSVPASAVLHRFHRVAVFVLLLERLPVPDELLTVLRVLVVGKAVELLLAHFVLQAPLLGEPPVPCSHKESYPDRPAE